MIECNIEPESTVGGLLDEPMTTKPRPRVLLVAVGLRPQMTASTAWLELIHTIEQFADLDHVGVEVHHEVSIRTRRKVFQAQRVLGRRPASDLTAGQRSAPLAGQGDYDLALLICPGPFDLFAVDDVRDRLPRCERVVAWPIETWPTQQHRSLSFEPAYWYDRIFVPSVSGAEMLSRAWGNDVPIEVLPLAVDTGRFGNAARTDRPVLAFNPGRRSDVQHRSLKAAAQSLDQLYLFDTLSSPMTIDPVEHRLSFAAMAGRSHLLICNYAKFDRPNEIGPAREIPGRLFEAIGAGALPVGSGPDPATLVASGLPPDVVLPLPLDRAVSSTEIARLRDAAAERSADLQRLARHQHDWTHRWIALCESVRIDPGAEALAYAAKLKAS